MKKTFITVFVLSLIAVFTFVGCGKTDVNTDVGSNISSLTESNANTDASESGNKTDSVSEILPSEETTSKNTYTYEHISLVLPENFTVNTDSSVPTAQDTVNSTDDNITFSKGGADSIDSYTQQVIEDLYKQLFTAFEKSLSFEKTKISGHDAIIYSYSLTVNGIHMIQTQYMIFGRTYSNIVTFTSVTGNYDNAFKECASTITVN